MYRDLSTETEAATNIWLATLDRAFRDGEMLRRWMGGERQYIDMSLSQILELAEDLVIWFDSESTETGSLAFCCSVLDARISTIRERASEFLSVIKRYLETDAMYSISPLIPQKLWSNTTFRRVALTAYDPVTRYAGSCALRTAWFPAPHCRALTKTLVYLDHARLYRQVTPGHLIAAIITDRIRLFGSTPPNIRAPRRVPSIPGRASDWKYRLPPDLESRIRTLKISPAAVRQIAQSEASDFVASVEPDL